MQWLGLCQLLQLIRIEMLVTLFLRLKLQLVTLLSKTILKVMLKGNYIKFLHFSWQNSTDRMHWCEALWDPWNGQRIEQTKPYIHPSMKVAWNWQWLQPCSRCWHALRVRTLVYWPSSCNPLQNSESRPAGSQTDWHWLRPCWPAA